MNVDHGSADWPDEIRRYWASLVAQAPQLASDIRSDEVFLREKRAAEIAALREEIGVRWLAGWRHFDAVQLALEQNGFALADRHEATNDSHSPVREAVVLLHAAATLTFGEIGVLLREGYVAGAGGRWRALHELAVTAHLVVKGGPSIAQRYLDHGFVNRVRRLEEFYKQPHPRAPDIQMRVDRLNRAAELVATHTLELQPIDFARPYGWAIPLMGFSKAGKYLEPTFDRLERLAGMEHLRLLVKNSAHAFVHNDSDGVRTAVLDDNGNLVIGPRPDEVQTVAIPTLDTVIQLVGATHLGFEPGLNDFSKLIGPVGSGLCALAADGITTFREADPTSVRLF